MKPPESSGSSAVVFLSMPLYVCFGMHAISFLSLANYNIRYDKNEPSKS